MYLHHQITMTRLLLIFISLNFSTISIGQNNFCLSDTLSPSGQILQRLKAEGIAGLTITNKRTFTRQPFRGMEL